MGTKYGWDHFIKMVDLFQLAPTIENYLLLRRTFTTTGVEASHFTFLDALSAVEAELRRHGIDSAVVSDALDGNDRQIDELCLQLMERLADRRIQKNSGKTHLQTSGQMISDSLIDYVLVAMLESCDQHGLPPPPSLVVLVRERLGGANVARHKQSLIDQRRVRAVWLAHQALASGDQISMRQIAKTIGVEASTVSRWFGRGELRREAEKIQKWFLKPNELTRKTKR